MKRLYVAVALFPVLVVAAAVFASARTDKPLPVAGLNGSGIGYCVTVEGPDGAVLGNVEVPYHVINPEQRKRRGLPKLDAQEFEASIYNATSLVVGAEAAKGSKNWVCSTTYRDKNGTVIGCQGACGDCVKVRVKAIQ